MRWFVPALLLVTACSSSTTAEPPAVPPTATSATADRPSSIPGGSSGDMIDPADAPTVPSTLAPVGTTGEPPPEAVGQPAGFETRQAVVTTADGSTCDLCVWLAETPADRSRGLMFVTDLGVGDAMAFRYPEPRTGTFWMKNTNLPLSIAFFAPDGAFMSSFDMEPCTTSTCPNYSTAENFLVALEVAQGRLTELGIGPGSSLELLDLPCD